MRRAILGRRSPRAAPINSLTSSVINSAATALTASRITSACSSSNTFLTTSSIVILSAPATRRLLSSSREKPDDLQRRVGRNHVPSDSTYTTLRDVTPARVATSTYPSVSRVHPLAPYEAWPRDAATSWREPYLAGLPEVLVRASGNGLARSGQADEARRMPVHPHARCGSRWRLGTAPIARPASGSARSSEPLPYSQIATSQKSRWSSIRMNRTILLPSLSRREGGKGCLSAGVRRWQGSQRGFNQRSEDDPLRSRNARAALYRAGGMARTGA
jgi:hypothetical protein